MSRPLFAPVLALALLVPVALPAAADGEDLPPAPAIAVSPGAVVNSATTLTASAVDEDPANVTFQWDIDYNATAGFVQDAAGPNVTRIFTTPGIHVVALRATDAAGNNATVTKNVAVDDYYQVSLDFVYPPDRDHAIFAHLRLVDYAGVGVEGKTVKIGILLQPQTDGTAHVIRVLDATTGPGGEKFFPIPRDTNLGNIPGRHVATAHASIADSVLGDTETATARVVYVIPTGL